MAERSLVLFTLLSQSACGALVGLAGVQILGSADVLGVISFIAVGSLLLAAATISTFHLGAPQHALYALVNWRSSWLSREIIMLGVTSGLVALGALVSLVATAETSLEARSAIGLLVAVAGVVLVATMVRLYTVRTIPEWRALTTAAQFGGTTLRLGGIVAGVLVTIAAWSGTIVGNAVLWIAGMLAVGLGLEVILLRQPTPKTALDAGALLARGVPMPDDGASLARLAGGVGAAAIGVVTLLVGPPQLALLLFLVGGLITVRVELGQRERFYALAPLQGRTVARSRRSSRVDSGRGRASGTSRVTRPRLAKDAGDSRRR